MKKILNLLSAVAVLFTCSLSVALAVPKAGASLANPPGSYTQSCTGCTTTSLGNDVVSVSCTACQTGGGTTAAATALIPYQLIDQISDISNRGAQLAVTYNTTLLPSELAGITYLYGQQ